MLNKIISICLIFILSPFLILISIIILFDDGFPIIFKQNRIGKDNKHFKIYKFRTMKNGTSDIPTEHLVYHKNLYSRIGPFLRKYSLDELPQLYNIIKGDLYFIGPRPALHNQDDLIKLRTKKNIHKLKPGLTGWAQVNGRDNISINQKVAFDEYFLKNKTFRLKVKILMYSLVKVLKADNIKI